MWDGSSRVPVLEAVFYKSGLCIGGLSEVSIVSSGLALYDFMSLSCPQEVGARPKGGWGAGAVTVRYQSPAAHFDLLEPLAVGPFSP